MLQADAISRELNSDKDGSNFGNAPPGEAISHHTWTSAEMPIAIASSRKQVAESFATQ
jgi:hypothetical protein